MRSFSVAVSVGAASAVFVLASNTVLAADDKQFSLVCRRIDAPYAPPIVFDVNLQKGTVTSPGDERSSLIPYTKPPKASITDTEIEVHEEYTTGWSETIINRYTGDGTQYLGQPGVQVSNVTVVIHCVKTAGKQF